jgi:hypothetical protein
MKKIVRLSENDLFRIVKKVLLEEEWGYVTSDLKDCKIETNSFKTIKEEDIIKILKGKLPDGKSTKFKVTGIFGDVYFNGKQYKSVGAILTPDTTIKMGPNSSVTMSGMGMPECSLRYTPNGIVFIAQHA